MVVRGGPARGGPVRQVGEEGVELGPGPRGPGGGGAALVLGGVEPPLLPVGVERGHGRLPLGRADAHRGEDAAGAIRFVLGVAHPSILLHPGRLRQVSGRIGTTARAGFSRTDTPWRSRP